MNTSSSLTPEYCQPRADVDVEDIYTLDGTMWDQPVSAEEQVLITIPSLVTHYIADLLAYQLTTALTKCELAL